MKSHDIAIITIIIALLIHMLTPHAHASPQVTVSFKAEESSRFFRATIRKANRKMRKWPVRVNLRKLPREALWVGLSKDGWTRGQAAICAYKGFGQGYVTIAEYNAQGESRKRHAVTVILHEVAHLIGAEHDDTLYNGRRSLILSAL